MVLSLHCQSDEPQRSYIRYILISQQIHNETFLTFFLITPHSVCLDLISISRYFITRRLLT